MSEAYKIVIEASKDGNVKKVPIAGNNAEAKDTKEQSEEKGITKNNIVGYVAYKKYVAPFVRQGFQYRISTVALKTGSVERQQRLQAGFDLLSQVGHIAESVVIGAKIGGAPGAMVGAVMSLATTYINYEQKRNIIDMNRALENEQISMLNARSGATNGNR
jgi:hypothetical protein